MVASVAADIRTYCTWHTEAMWKFGNCLVRRSTRPRSIRSVHLHGSNTAVELVEEEVVVVVVVVVDHRLAI